MFITTCNKIFHTFSNCAAGVLCPQRIWRGVKNCLLLLLVAFLAMPTISVSAVEPRAAKPVPPDGYEERELEFTMDSLSPVLTFSVAGSQTITPNFTVTGKSNLDILDLDSIWNSTLYLDSVTQTRTQVQSRPYGSTEWSEWFNLSPPVLGGNFTIEQLSASSINGTINTPYLYLPMLWNNRALNIGGNFTFTGNVAHSGDKFIYKVTRVYKFIYFVKVPSSTDNILDSIGNAAQQITDAVTNNTNVVHNDFTQVKTGISTINGNLNNINTSIKNGFQDTVDNLQSLESSVNAGFTDVENGIKQQTTQIQSSISNQTTQITQNNNQNTQKILDQNSQFRQEDLDKANSIGTVAQNFLDTNVEKAKSNFNILWEPIAFTQRMLSVFSGGTRSATYANYLDGVVGFTYNAETGCLDPIIDTGPRARYGRASSGTTITFPAYTLPVLNIKLWEEYSFDISEIKDSFPVLFNAIYVVTGCLCLYWFLGFLSEKFEEVYKE